MLMTPKQIELLKNQELIQQLARIYELAGDDVETEIGREGIVVKTKKDDKVKLTLGTSWDSLDALLVSLAILNNKASQFSESEE